MQIEKETLLRAAVVTVMICFVGLLFCKKKKVESDKQHIEQEIHQREQELREVRPDVPLDILCAQDQQFWILKELANQINIYLYMVNFSMVFFTIPLIFSIYNGYNYMYPSYKSNLSNNDNTNYIPINNNGNSNNIPINNNANFSTINNGLMDNSTNQQNETNSEVYMTRHLNGATPIEKYLKTVLIDKSIFNSNNEKWILLKTLDRKFLMDGISQSERIQVLKVALNITKIAEPTTVTFANSTLSSKGLQIAKSLAKHCIMATDKFNPTLDVFTGASQTVGGNSITSKQFLDNLQRNLSSKGIERANILNKHFL